MDVTSVALDTEHVLFYITRDVTGGRKSHDQNFGCGVNTISEVVWGPVSS